jgi:hypothetical protein
MDTAAEAFFYLEQTNVTAFNQIGLMAVPFCPERQEIMKGHTKAAKNSSIIKQTYYTYHFYEIKY